MPIRRLYVEVKKFEENANIFFEAGCDHYKFVIKKPDEHKITRIFNFFQWTPECLLRWMANAEGDNLNVMLWNMLGFGIQETLTRDFVMLFRRDYGSVEALWRYLVKIDAAYTMFKLIVEKAEELETGSTYYEEILLDEYISRNFMSTFLSNLSS